MPGLLPNVDPDGLLEFSVVYTDRSLNHMSTEFKKVITDISAILKDVYKAHSTVVIPGSGTYGMEAVARQFAPGKKCLIIRNGWFSYRWTQIFDLEKFTKDIQIIKDPIHLPPLKRWLPILKRRSLRLCLLRT
jgi:aspartate aminotransferase-like enzyme